MAAADNPLRGRRDTASKLIKAAPQTIYRAFVEPDNLIRWLPPTGMTGRIHAYDARDGGAYRMSLHYVGTGHATPGKTSEHEDVVQGIFLRLVPDERIEQLVAFESDDPAFAGAMTMTWTLTAVPEGTQVDIVCENVPPGIRPEDHEVGMLSSLNNLAAFVERQSEPRERGRTTKPSP